MKFRIHNYFFPTRIFKYRRLMQEAPGWSSDRLAAWSLEQRRSLALHAYEQVPYYRRVFNELGILPEHCDRSEVWQRLPTLNKLTLQQNTQSLLARGRVPKSAFWAHTSGSTGTPLSVLLDSNVNAAAFAMFWRCWESGGYWHIGQRQAAMKTKYYTEGWKYVPLIRTLHVSPTHITQPNLRSVRDVMARYQPRFLRGFPSAAYLFCRLLREHGLSLHVPMFVSGAEVLLDFQRAEIEKTLGARIYNHYPHWERAASILECDAGGLHCQEDYGHHEILDEQGRAVPPRGVGELVVTSVHNRAMPLIRYRTGDMASWSLKSCSCGQSFPVIENIAGRQSDYIVRLDGSLMPGTAVTDTLDESGGILYWQIVQSEPSEIEVRVVKAPSYREPEDTDRIVANLRNYVGADMQIRVRFCQVEELERNPIGKIRYCYNRLPQGQLAVYQTRDSPVSRVASAFYG